MSQSGFFYLMCDSRFDGKTFIEWGNQTRGLFNIMAESVGQVYHVSGKIEHFRITERFELNMY